MTTANSEYCEPCKKLVKVGFTFTLEAGTTLKGKLLKNDLTKLYLLCGHNIVLFAKEGGGNEDY